MICSGFRNLLWLAGFILIIYSCANKGYPEGGPKDETPPVVIREDPVSYTTNFDRPYINIYFDEFVQLKNVTEKFVISPPQARKPRVRLRGKYIRVDFQDTLRPGMTYSLDFADAIVDNNEGNPLGYYRYVFSTGDFIDTLEMGGVVRDAETNLPVYGVNVYIYENHQDSVPITQMPDYMAMTDSSGIFRVTNIKDTVYRVIAVKDDSRDYRFTPESEKVAFFDSLVRPQVFPVMIADTLDNDSIVLTEQYAYGPTNILLRLFQEKSTNLYMTDDGRPERERLNFIFSIPGENRFTIDPVGQEVENWYVQESSPGRDTISIWITDSTLYNMDTLRFRVNYLFTDTTRQYVERTDTLRMVYSERQTTGRTQRERRREEEEPVEVAPDFLTFSTNLKGSMGLNQKITITFEKPIRIENIRNFRLEETLDSVFYELDYQVEQDSHNIRRFMLNTRLTPGATVKLSLDSAMIYNMYGEHNNIFSETARVKTEEDYGRIIVNVSGVEEQVIVQLFESPGEITLPKEGELNLRIRAEQIIDKNERVVFSHIQPGRYRVRFIKDRNRNGRWDTGLYLQRIQPEEILYYPTEINLRKNFDVENEVDLSELKY